MGKGINIFLNKKNEFSYLLPCNLKYIEKFLSTTQNGATLREMYSTMFYPSWFTTEGEIFIVENMLFSRQWVYKNEKVMSLFFQELMVIKE